jgi:Subtilase family/Fervidolysin N-terminal prodomain
MNRLRKLTTISCLWLAFNFVASAQTNSLVWNKTNDRVDADIRSETLLPLLEKISAETGWRVFVEPGTARNISAKFKNLPSGDALKMLLGDLNFALIPKTNAASQLYVFRTAMKNATRLVASKKSAKHVPNELLLRVKPGTDIDALAKLLGAKITGHLDKYGIYRLQFADADATDAALAQLQNNSDVLDADYNYYFDPPPTPQAISSAPVGPLSLQLNPPPSSGKVIVGLIDTDVESLGAQLDKFILPEISAADGTPSDDGLTHGTAMAYTILDVLGQMSSGGTSVEIQPVDVYGSSETTTSWNVALGIQEAVDAGATVLNLSLGGSGDSSILDDVIAQTIADDIPSFAAAGNTHVDTPTYPAAVPGVNAVTALQNGQIAPYANYGSFVDMAFPGTSVVYFNGQPYLVTGTSTATAIATGAAAGNETMLGWSWSQIEAAMQKKFAVPTQ